MAREYVEFNPASKLKPLKTDKKLPSYVKEEEISALLDSMKFPENFQGKRDQLLLELFYATGMRLSEMTGLKDDDVSIHNSTLRVLGKRNKERIIPIPESLIVIVGEYRKNEIRRRNAK